MPSPPYAQRDDPASSSLVVRHPKRRGVALSCAECRRLKLKCSRAFPCSNCVKKGCAAICPEGSLTTGKGNRFVLANTEVLHEKITLLANRVRNLEDALAQSHAHNSTTRHPLLTDDLLQIKRPLERERLNVLQTEEKPETEDNIGSLGSLSISNDGRSTFFGRTASSWYLLQNEEGSDEEDESQTNTIGDSPGPSDPAWLSYAFPFAPPVEKTVDSVRQIISSKLPGQPLGKAICDIYFRHAAWMYTPIMETEFYETVFRPIYDAEIFEVGGHTLTIYCMVLAIGTLLDLDKPPHSQEAMEYYHLARIAVSIDSVLEEQTIPAIQALLLMCHFMFLAEISSARWAIMGIVVKLAQSVGLHRDSGKWNLDSDQTRKRRELFYELLTYDSWQSLTFGRPPSLSSAHIDSQLPHETTKNAKGEVEMSFAAWKHRYSAQCLSVVHDEAFGTRNPNYKVIQDLDRKVRNWYVPPSLQVPGFGAPKLVSNEVEQPTVQLTMQRYIAFAIREMTLFYMHRGFFAQALEDSPADPMGSKYSPSVLAAYTSATTFVGLIESLFNQHQQLTERMWFLFTHVFSCSIVLGSIAAKSQMALARSALSHLDSAYNLFSKVSDHGRAGKILPILAKLKEKAHLANTNLTMQHETPNRHPFYSPKIKSEVDELSALGGMTRLVARRTSTSPSVSTPSPSLNHQSPPVIAESQEYMSPVEDAPTNSWQNYTPVENYNVGLNNLGSEFYATNAMQNDGSADMSMMYQIPSHQLQQQQQQHHHHHHHQNLGMEMSQHQTYYSNGYGSSYGNGNQYMMHQAPSTPMHDMHDSWQNLMAQYKQ